MIVRFQFPRECETEKYAYESAKRELAFTPRLTRGTKRVPLGYIILEGASGTKRVAMMVANTVTGKVYTTRFEPEVETEFDKIGNDPPAE